MVCARACVFLVPILGNTADGSRPHVSPWRAFTQDWWVRFYSSFSSLLPICSLSLRFLYSNRHSEHSRGEIVHIKGWIGIFSNLPWICEFVKVKNFISVPLESHQMDCKHSLGLSFCHTIIFALYWKNANNNHKLDLLKINIFWYILVAMHILVWYIFNIIC